LLGCFIFVQEGVASWEVHTALLPHAVFPRGRSLAAARGVIQWIFSNRECQRIITRVPASNPLALRFALHSGLIEWGINPRSWLKGGKLWDQTYLGISNSEVTSCQQL
jgi:RimJ/RimL family protein N-acetyltransferase